MADKMLEVLETFGSVHAMVVFGHDGLDELSTTAPSTLIESVREQDGTCRHRRLEIEPTSLGLKLASLGDLAGGDAARTRNWDCDCWTVSAVRGAIWCA